MSKSLKRVRQNAIDLGLNVEIIELTIQTKTAAEAASAMGCCPDQILKSIIFLGQDTNKCVLFMTAGGNRVDEDKASAIVGEPLGRADAAVIRTQTGFAIGGVSPIGHITDVQKFIDPTLMAFETIWAAAGTPHSMFSIDPQTLADATGAKIVDFTQ
jgi:prolyl-tRNA editing enzyme YbaK/EbsC (Cys-tRNA(Pro) deacylase)